MDIIKQNNLIGWLVANKYFKLHPGICPIGYRIIKPLCLSSYPIVNFFRNNKIIYLCEDAIQIYEKYKNNKNCMIIMDPPYISTTNDYYYDHNMNIYEYLNNNNISKENAKIYLILENIWIIKLLFQNKFILFEYHKMYVASHKKTTHILISKIK